MAAPVRNSVKDRLPFVRNLTIFFTHPPSRAIGLVFASLSVQFGGWSTHIPYVKAKLGLDDAQLGLTLFALPAGLVLMNPFSSLLIGRFGAPQVTVFSVLLYGCCVFVPVAAPNVPVLVVGLFLTGTCGALLNVAMNTCATAIERAEKRTIMATCHGLWSLGGLVGAGLSGGLMGLRVSPQVHMAGLAAVVLALNLWQRSVVMRVPFVREQPGAWFTWPNRALAGMIFIGLAIGMGEGVAFDWSAVYLKDYLRTSAGVAALGFAGFSLAMTLGRFTGDTLILKFGENALLTASGLIGAGGLALAVLLPFPLTAIAGFTLLGAGCALGAPILYSASARLPGLAPGVGLATFATFSFIGFLAGPPLIGIIAREVGLSTGFAVVAVLLLGAAGLSRRVDL
ncbi:MAG: MFS transporter [Ferruginibacter sp.]|nr:MFS transporter [Cytophagales bacterium]